jgi:hypothetical protein
VERADSGQQMIYGNRWDRHIAWLICPALLVPSRLDFRLIRVRSPTFTYYRFDFPTQVKDGAD